MKVKEKARVAFERELEVVVTTHTGEEYTGLIWRYSAGGVAVDIVAKEDRSPLQGQYYGRPFIPQELIHDIRFVDEPCEKSGTEWEYMELVAGGGWRIYEYTAVQEYIGEVKKEQDAIDIVDTHNQALENAVGAPEEEPSEKALLTMEDDIEDDMDDDIEDDSIRIRMPERKTIKGVFITHDENDERKAELSALREENAELQARLTVLEAPVTAAADETAEECPSYSHMTRLSFLEVDVNHKSLGYVVKRAALETIMAQNQEVTVDFRNGDEITGYLVDVSDDTFRFRGGCDLSYTDLGSVQVVNKPEDDRDEDRDNIWLELLRAKEEDRWVKIFYSGGIMTVTIKLVRDGAVMFGDGGLMLLTSINSVEVLKVVCEPDEVHDIASERWEAHCYPSGDMAIRLKGTKENYAEIILSAGCDRVALMTAAPELADKARRLLRGIATNDIISSYPAGYAEMLELLCSLNIAVDDEVGMEEWSI